MSPFPFDANPYTFNAVSLVIIGLAATFYLIRLRDRSDLTRLAALGLGWFTTSMLSMLLANLAPWGGAFNPFTDACAVASMTTAVELAYHIPTRAATWEARLARGVSRAASLVALAFSLVYMVWMLAKPASVIPVPTAYWFLNPAIFLLALGTCIRRTIQAQTGRSAVQALLHPADRLSRLLRNYSLALSIGLVQGVASGLGLAGAFPPLLGAVLINLSLLLMLATMVYAAFDLTPQQPNLVVRLVGLSLVTVAGVLGAVGLYNIDLATRSVLERNLSLVETVRQELRSDHTDTLPSEIVYLARWTDDGAPALLVAPPPGAGVDLSPVDPAAHPRWEYYIEQSLRSDAGAPIRLRYSSQAVPMNHTYAGYPFELDGARYEAGFSLEAMSAVTRAQSGGMVWAALVSGLFILFVFPRVFQANLIEPLDRLLSAVRRADQGDLQVEVPVTHADEVGFLTQAFNKMTASLRRELEARQHAEDELRRLNLTLEERVAGRTHELEALFDVTAVSSQVDDPSTLVKTLLERTLNALRSPIGLILLGDDAATDKLRLAAAQGIPTGWQDSLKDGWAAAAAARSEPLLVTDTTGEPRVPDFMRHGDPLTLLLAPLRAESQSLGLLVMARPALQRYDLDEVALLISLANQVGAAVRTNHLRRLANQASMLEERQRLSRDLHDSVIQSLYGLTTLTEVGLMRVDAGDLPASAQAFTRIGQTARQAIREMRLFIHQLRPPVLEQEGLVNALDLRLAAVEGRADLRARLLADESLSFSPAVQTALYNIAQEALNNTLKHAQAANVTVRLARWGASGVVLEVVDDGQGFSLADGHSGGMGLESMRARAAEIGAHLEIQSQPGQGTRVSVTLEEPI